MRFSTFMLVIAAAIGVYAITMPKPSPVIADDEVKVSGSITDSIVAKVLTVAGVDVAAAKIDVPKSQKAQRATNVAIEAFVNEMKTSNIQPSTLDEVNVAVAEVSHNSGPPSQPIVDNQPPTNPTPPAKPLLMSQPHPDDAYHGYRYAYEHSKATGCPLMVMVGANWCQVCPQVEDQLRASSAPSKADIAYVDYDRDPIFARKLMQGDTLPQLSLYQNINRQPKRLIGYSTTQQIDAMFDPANGFGPGEYKSTLPASEYTRRVSRPRGSGLRLFRGGCASCGG